MLQDYKGEIYYETSHDDFNNNYNITSGEDIDKVLGKFNVLIHGKFAILLTYHEIFVHKPLLVFSNGAKFQVLLSKPIYISFC